KEDTKDVSTVTTPASITLKGDQTVYVIQGQQYVDSGAVVTNGKLVKTTGTVLNTVPGSYSIKYIAANNDGVLYTATRTVTVLQLGDGSLDLSGTYFGGRGSVPVPAPVTITKIAQGVFKVSDFFAEYYEVKRGLGATYTAPGLLTYLGNNIAIMPVDASSPWGPINIVKKYIKISQDTNGKISMQYFIMTTADQSAFPGPFYLNQQ
ncbi:MAG: DUF5012 domain-containing protein, partial [Bacteroidota bacterium]|nr:DUF5012 domain-containing protein [Bacteroidota bacterium]